MNTVRLLAVALASLAGCASGPEHVYKLYPGPEQESGELATLSFGDNVWQATIDGLHVSRSDYSVIELEPGRHELEFSAMFHVSVLVNSSMRDGVGDSFTVDLEPGKRYVMKGDRTTGYGYSMYLWLEDAATGDVVLGWRKP